jgi:hypothetical protein
LFSDRRHPRAHNVSYDVRLLAVPWAILAEWSLRRREEPGSPTRPSLCPGPHTRDAASQDYGGGHWVKLLGLAFKQKGSECPLWVRISDVRFAPESGHVRRRNRCLLCAISSHTRGQNASEPWNFSAVSDVASVSPNWTPTFIENAIAEGSLACSSPLALALPGLSSPPLASSSSPPKL